MLPGEIAVADALEVAEMVLGEVGLDSSPEPQRVRR
jgi:hypothetical protein